jgi:hypothetical protein
MNRKYGLVVGMSVIALIGALWVGQRSLQAAADAQNVQAPMFEVDPFWPKPLPSNWRLGSSIGVWVDDQQNVWMVHRSSATLGDNERAAELDPPDGECCIGAPPILAFDKAGNLIHSWGGPGEGYDWPESNHGIFVDHMGYVWIGANGGPDSHILKFTKDGKFVAQFGKPGARATGAANAEGVRALVRNSHDQVSFGRVAKIFVDAETNETYVSDGYFNRRVAVLDANTGVMKRYWGGYGNRPDDNYTYRPQGSDDQSPPQQFRGPVHCVMIANDDLVYVCDRGGDRVQVFQKNGTYVKEAFFAPKTLRSGSTWDIAFSADPQQRYLYIVDGVNERVRVVERQTLVEVTSFGQGGRQPGQWYGAHSIATDAEGNIYTTETYEGKRIQKFVYKGMGAVPRVQGAAWPTS